jgi:endoglucanase
MSQFYPLAGAMLSPLIAPSPGGGGSGGGVTPPAGVTYGLYNYPSPFAAAQENHERSRWGRAANADLIHKIVAQPSAVWVGGWGGGTSGNYTSEVNLIKGLLDAAKAASSLTNILRGTVVIYGAPFRDAGGASAGGFPDNPSYKAWVTAMSKAIGTSPANVIIEADGVVMSLPTTQQAQRYQALRDAANALADNCPNARVYLDAGNHGWKNAATMVSRIIASGVPMRRLRGISSNVSNYHTTASETTFCEAIITGLKAADSTLDLHYIIDTGRNGNGPGNTQFDPVGRALGARPILDPDPAHPLCDAWLWVKSPGGSDIPFSGLTHPWTKYTDPADPDGAGPLPNPPAGYYEVYSGGTGDWHMDRALEMAANAAW